MGQCHDLENLCSKDPLGRIVEKGSQELLGDGKNGSPVRISHNMYKSRVHEVVVFHNMFQNYM